MCAQFELAVNIGEVVAALESAARRMSSGDDWLKRLEDLKSEASSTQLTWKPRALPYYQAPVLRQDAAEDRLRLDLLQFSLVPTWSKEKRVKFATHNARLFTHDEKSRKDTWIYEKPTWKAPFVSRHCIVPMTGFYEAVYEGLHAGHMIQFKPDTPDGLLFAGGIWEEWHSKSTGEVIESFTVLTDDPIPFVAENGHDRSPVFLKPEQALEWLSHYPKRPEQAVEFLRAAKTDVPLKVVRDRELKSAKKRARLA